MESMVISQNFWHKKSVFITGHTGFKGGWMSHLLTNLGASVYGFSLEPNTKENFFNITGVKDKIEKSTIGNILDYQALKNALTEANPEIIFHMAAQPLVRYSYKNPIETFSTNIIGTANLLEIAREINASKAILNITSDKCYQNNEWIWPYRENDILGGHDPYSASKACSELITASYRDSFLNENGIHIATARAGNVIGGGDWSDDRLIPDFIRSIFSDKKFIIRSPNATRPWQHVLEPISGYILLAEKLCNEGSKFTGAWNFGPNNENIKSVEWIAKKVCEQFQGSAWEIEKQDDLHEANLLTLDNNKSRIKLGWTPKWDINVTLKNTIDWYKAWSNNEDMKELTDLQIYNYSLDSTSSLH